MVGFDVMVQSGGEELFLCLSAACSFLKLIVLRMKVKKDTCRHCSGNDNPAGQSLDTAYTIKGCAEVAIAHHVLVPMTA